MGNAVQNGIDSAVCRIITPEFRACYPHLFKPNGMPGATPKYSILMSFPKTMDLSVLKTAIKNAKIYAYGPDPSKYPPGLSTPVVDGDLPKYAGKEGYTGSWLVKATSNADSRPGVVDEHRQEIIDPAKFYPGCYARAQIFVRIWEYMGKQGVHCILDNVQFLRDGKSFGGRKPASEAFGPHGAAAAAEDEENGNGFM